MSKKTIELQINTDGDIITEQIEIDEEFFNLIEETCKEKKCTMEDFILNVLQNTFVKDVEI